MLVLEKFFSPCGRHLRRITRPDALWPGVFSSCAPEANPGFTDRFEKNGGEILDIVKVAPNPDFAPLLQRITE
jgi:hypothetical protein